MTGISHACLGPVILKFKKFTVNHNNSDSEKVSELSLASDITEWVK